MIRLNTKEIDDFSELKVLIKEFVDSVIDNVKYDIKTMMKDLEENISDLREDMCKIFETNFELVEGDYNYN